MRDVLRRSGAAQSLPQELVLDVLARSRDRHHLISRVALKFPTAVRACDVDPIAEVFDRVRKLGSIDGAGEGLGPIDLYWIEDSPCSVGSPRHVRDDDVSMEMRIRTVPVVRAALRRSGGDVIEARGD